MHRALYLTATGPRTGKRAIALGTMSILSRNMQDVAIFRPIINEPQLDDRAPDINLLLEHFKLKQDYCDTFAYTYQEVRTIINQGDRNLVIENIIQKFKELQSRHDFVLCVGTDFLGKDPVFEFELNAEIASNLGCPVMLITSGEGKSAEEVRDSLLVTRDSMAPYSLDVIATIVNRSSLTRAEADDLSDIFAADDKPGYSVVSSVFLMCLKDRVLVFGDCAVNPNPTSQQLAEIAVASADTAKVFGIDPRVAMLSYSTGTSGKGADVDVVVEATALAKEKAPELSLEGPLQYDAAIDPTVAKTKLPNSKVAGKATVFIFPDLNTGNNTYKAVQRAAEAVAIGPVLQGLNKPVNDLSRGCTVPDIVNTVAITAIQAAAEKQK